MAEGRIQFPAGTSADWQKYNPDIRYGELIIERKPTGGATFRSNLSEDGLAHPYNDSTILWDSDVAKKAASAADSAATAANTAQANATMAGNYAKEAAQAVNQLNEKKILLTLSNLQMSLNMNDGGLDIDILRSSATAEGG